jgi:hypothetical protein
VLIPPGVNLNSLDPDDWDDLILGTGPTGFEFVCPTCKSRYRNDAENMPPLCTGPHPSLDEHEPTVTLRA